MACSFLVTYTWSKSIDDSSQADDNVTWLGSFTSLQDPNKPSLERSLSTFDIPMWCSSATPTICPLDGTGLFSATCRACWRQSWRLETNGIWRIFADGRPTTLTLAMKIVAHLWLTAA